MLHVTLVNLSSDFRPVPSGTGRSTLEAVSPEQLIALLERFRTLDRPQHAEAEPQVVIVSPAGRHIVRAAEGRLFLHDARNASAPARELTAVAISEALTATERAVDAGALGPDASHPLLERRRAPSRRRGLALVLIAGCVLLNVHTFVSATRHEPLNSRPAVQFITDAAELNARRQSAVGRYATGTAPGDRQIEIRADGRIRFARVVPAGERLLGEDSYRIGRGESGAICLVTPRHGIVELRNIDTVVYYRDTYRRQP